MKDRILAGLDDGKSKEEILREIIDDEVRTAFKEKASDKMTESIAQTFDENDELRAMINRLFSEAQRGREKNS